MIKAKGGQKKDGKCVSLKRFCIFTYRQCQILNRGEYPPGVKKKKTDSGVCREDSFVGEEGQNTEANQQGDFNRF